MSIDEATPAQWDKVANEYAGPDGKHFKPIPRKPGRYSDIQDNINHPRHYNDGKIECIDYIEDRLSEEQFIGYLWGNLIKYAHRWPNKGGIEDLRKARWYLERLIKEV